VEGSTAAGGGGTIEAALAARGDCLPTAGKALTGAGAGAGRAGAALLAGAAALPGAALAAGALAVRGGLFFTIDGAALDAGLAATLDADLAWTGTGLPLALAGVGLAAGADFWAMGLLAVLLPALCGAGFFTAEMDLGATDFAAGVFLAGVGLGFLAVDLAAVLVAALTTGLAAGWVADLTAGLAFTAGWGCTFLATALAGLAGVAALPAFLATGLALVTAAPFLVLAVDMQGLLRYWPPPDGRLDNELDGRVTQIWVTCSPGVAPEASPFAQHWARAIVATGWSALQTRHLSRPWKKISLGKSKPMKTILLLRTSSAAQAGPKSLPINWCTPWKMTLRSVPFMNNTPL